MEILAAKRASLKALNPFLVESQPLYSLITTNRRVENSVWLRHDFIFPIHLSVFFLT